MLRGTDSNMIRFSVSWMVVVPTWEEDSKEKESILVHLDTKLLFDEAHILVEIIPYSPDCINYETSWAWNDELPVHSIFS